jgi:DNA-binding GntR family transcriptional regulator
MLHAEWSATAADLPKPNLDFVYLDERFHLELAQAAGNIAVAEYLQMIGERIRVVRMQDFLDPSRTEATARQHLEILDAVMEERIDTAATLLAAHLDEALLQVSKRAAAAIERMITAGALVNPELSGPPPAA